MPLDAAPLRGPRGTRALLAALLLCSASLCLTGLDWGLPYEWVVDARTAVADRLVAERAPAPDFFTNPTGSLYLEMAIVAGVRAAHPGARLPGSTFEERRPLTDSTRPLRAYLWRVYRGVRGLSAALSVLTVYLLFRIATRRFGGGAGLIAAGSLAFTMGFAIYGHMNLPEPATVLLTLVAVARFERVASHGSMRDYVLAGLATGAACATKYTACVLAVPFLAAHLVGTARVASRDSLMKVMAAAATVVLAFLALMPAAALKWGAFKNSLAFTVFSGFAATESAPHGEQSWGPYLAILGNTMGWPLFILGLIGLVAALVRLVRRGVTADPALLVHVAWILSLYSLCGISSNRAMRFILPIVPSLALLGAAAASAGWTHAGSSRRRTTIAVTVGAVLVYSAAYTAAGVRLLLRDPRYAAGEWLSTHAASAGLIRLAWDANAPYIRGPLDVRRFDAINDETVDDTTFVRLARALLRDERALLVGAGLSNTQTDWLDARQVKFLDMMQADRSPDAYREVARFEVRQPWWLDPRPDEVAPIVMVYARPGVAGGR